MKDLPSEILVQIFQYLTIQDCLRGVGRVCRRFQGLIEYTGEVWRTLETDVELSTEAFQSIMRHAKLIRKLGLRFSQKRLRYASPDMYIDKYGLPSTPPFEILDPPLNRALHRKAGKQRHESNCQPSKESRAQERYKRYFLFNSTNC